MATHKVEADLSEIDAVDVLLDARCKTCERDADEFVARMIALANAGGNTFGTMEGGRLVVQLSPAAIDLVVRFGLVDVPRIV